MKGRYLREVGALYAELDDLNAKIVELAAEIDDSEEARSVAAEARAEAEGSYAAAHGEAAEAAALLAISRVEEAVQRCGVEPDPSRLALLEDDADRSLRTCLMAEANAGLQTPGYGRA